MKILMLTSTFPPYKGGIGNVAFYEADGLAELGHDVTVLTPRYRTRPGRTDDEVRPARFTVDRVETAFEFGNAAICRGLADRLETAETVYLEYPFFGAAERVGLVRTGKTRKRQRLVIRYNMDVVGKGWKGLVFGFHTRFVMPRILKAADKVIFSTFDYARHSDAAWFLEKHAGKCAEIPYGVSLSMFHPDPCCAKSDKTLLFVGGLDEAHYFKGLENLLHAVAPLMARDRDIVLNVVGKGNLLDRYRKISRSLGMESNARFLTDCDDDNLRRRYTEALATILPAADKSESFGLVLLESMACGTAVVAGDLPGVRTLVRDGENGCLARRAGGVDGLREAIERLLADPARARVMGENGRRMVVGEYDWRAVVKEVAGVLAGNDPKSNPAGE